MKARKGWSLYLKTVQSPPDGASYGRMNVGFVWANVKPLSVTPRICTCGAENLIKLFKCHLKGTDALPMTYNICKSIAHDDCHKKTAKSCFGTIPGCLVSPISTLQCRGAMRRTPNWKCLGRPRGGSTEMDTRKTTRGARPAPPKRFPRTWPRAWSWERWVYDYRTTTSYLMMLIQPITGLWALREHCHRIW